MSDLDFTKEFSALAGRPDQPIAPFPWQERLYRDFIAGQIPDAIDIPTGLGKTSVMTIWLLARAAGAAVPRRLVYVVDRRAVVDQATNEAEVVRARLGRTLSQRMGIEQKGLAISTLRGGFADNRDWLADPSAAAIVVGTVDMIGSRLLFEGYGVSRSMRPYHAAMLGVDTLVVLDEAHLSSPFAALVSALHRPALQGRDAIVPPAKLMALSATGRGGRRVFGIDAADRAHPIVKTRLEARKALRIRDLETTNAKTIAVEAWTLADTASAPSRILVYLESREMAAKVHAEIGKRARREKARAILLVGARRGLERDRVAADLAETGFLAGGTRPRAHVFLIATAAGEVGIDLDADHMLCDLVAWERMVQRLGRVNRRGDSGAEVVVLDLGEKAIPKKAPDDEAERRAAARALLSELPPLDDEHMQAGPGALITLRSQPELVVQQQAATTPDPLHPPLDRPTVEAWALTGLREHTGRPEVGPWLRGWVESEPETEVLWRTHLPVCDGLDGPEVLPESVVAFFAAARPHTGERLTTETFRVEKWLFDKRGSVGARLRAAFSGPSPDLNIRPEEIAALVLDQSLNLHLHLTCSELAEMSAPDAPRAAKQARDRLVRALTGRILVVDARLGGLREGLLDAGEVEPPITADSEPDRFGEVLGAIDRPAIGFRVLRRATTASADEQAAGWRVTLRLDAARDASGETAEELLVLGWRGSDEPERARSIAGRYVTLAEHTDHVEARVRELARRLDLPEPEAEALALAARLHDCGKAAAIWQRAMNAPEGGPWAKTRGGDGRRLAGYRHEFGSLVEAAAEPLPETTRDLILHLIAAHHGNARPLIASAGCEAGPPSVLSAHAGEAARRFARLQRHYGPWGLAWREAILRAADQQASAEEQEGA